MTKQISQLTAKPSPVAATDQFGIDDNSAVSYKVTMSNVQTYVNSNLPSALVSIAGLTTSADKMIYTTASNVYAVTSLTAFGRTLLDDEDAATAAATLEVLPLAGGTMTGPLILDGNPVADLQAVPKQYLTEFMHYGLQSFGPTGGANVQLPEELLNCIEVIVEDGFNVVLPTMNLSNVEVGQSLIITGKINTPTFNILDQDGNLIAAGINYYNFALLTLLDTVSEPFNGRWGASVISPSQYNKPAARVVSTSNLTATYSNGTSGIGATLTNAGAMTALEIDGKLLAVGDGIVVAGQTTLYENGLYIVTSIGSGASNWQMERSIYFNNSVTGRIRQGDFIFVMEGGDNANSLWFNETEEPVIVGTTDIEFDSIYAASGVTVGTYGTANAVPTLEIDDKGIITSAVDTPINFYPAINNFTTSQTLTTATANSFVEFDSASAVNYTVDTNANEPTTAGHSEIVTQIGAGQITFVPEAGVTFISADGALTTRTPGSQASISRTSVVDTWVISGDLVT